MRDSAMLFQQQTESQHSEEVHVTSQELARALSAIESRRQAQAERDIDTIALGEAIRQLGLDVTADELMAEVRAQREAEMVEAETIVDQPLRRRSGGWLRKLIRTVG
jgi:hypothetical protein